MGPLIAHAIEPEVDGRSPNNETRNTHCSFPYDHVLGIDSHLGWS